MVLRLIAILPCCLVIASCGRHSRHNGVDLVSFDISNPGVRANDGTVGFDPCVRYRRIYLDCGRLGATAKVRAFGHTSAVVYDAAPPSTISEFNARMGEQLELAKRSLMPRVGTRTASVLAETVADAIAVDANSRTSTIQIYTDGGIEDQGPKVIASIRDSVEKLKQLNHFQGIALIGCLPEHRRQWEQWLAPLGDRGVVAGLTDADYQLGSLAARIGVEP